MRNVFHEIFRDELFRAFVLIFGIIGLLYSLGCSDMRGPVGPADTFRVGWAVGRLIGQAMVESQRQQQNQASTSTIIVECPHCKGQVQVGCPGNYSCPHCNNAFTVGNEVQAGGL